MAPTDTHARAQRDSRPVLKRTSQDNLWKAAALGIVYSSDLNSRGEFDPRASTLPAPTRPLPFQRQERPQVRLPPPPVLPPPPPPKGDANPEVEVLRREIAQLEKENSVQAAHLARQRTLISAFCDYIR